MVVPQPVCDFDANGLAVNDRKALEERFITRRGLLWNRRSGLVKRKGDWAIGDEVL